MAEMLKVCHDRIPPQEFFRPQRTVATRGGAPRAVLEFRKLWVNGSILRVRFMGGTPAQQALVKTQAMWRTDHTNLQFEFSNAPDAEIRIAFNQSDGAWSNVGTDCQSVPRNQPTMNLGFLEGGTATHEFGHAIGLGHEHQNPAGGLEWHEEVVIRDLGGPPNFWTPEEVRFNVLEKYTADQIRGTVFDPASIMLYAFPSRWTKNGVSTNANTVLSTMDKTFIASAQAYPRGVVNINELHINATTSTWAGIGVPVEEDLFTFAVTQEGRHIIETGGQTDVVMKLFGPNSQTSLVAEDDDGGVGLNARIVAGLVPGRYFVQIRHFNTASGTGAYTIRVQV